MTREQFVEKWSKLAGFNITVLKQLENDLDKLIQHEKAGLIEIEKPEKICHAGNGCYCNKHSLYMGQFYGYPTATELCETDYKCEHYY